MLIYDWHGERVVDIIYPDDIKIGSPSFSHDDTKLSILSADIRARVWQGIEIYDRRTAGIQNLYRAIGGEVIRTKASFSPDNGNLLFGKAVSHRSIDLHCISTSTLVLSGVSASGFKNIEDPAFLDESSIVFYGLVTDRQSLVAELSVLGLDRLSSLIWKLNLNTNGYSPYFPSRRENVFPPDFKFPVSGLAVASSNRSVFTVTRSNQRPTGNAGEFFYQISQIHADGEYVAVSPILNAPTDLVVSANSKIAAFREDAARTRMDSLRDVWILDLGSRVIYETNLARRLNSDARFNAL